MLEASSPLLPLDFQHSLSSTLNSLLLSIPTLHFILLVNSCSSLVLCFDIASLEHHPPTPHIWSTLMSISVASHTTPIPYSKLLSSFTF